MSDKKKGVEKWQAQKSELMRDRIIIATLECIVQFGYENTTMAKIAAVAKVSRGSMQYHFGSKIEAIKAAINYLHTKRLADHQQALEDVPEGTDPMAFIFDFYWRQLNEDYFIAYQDLVIAARTHPELAAELEPAYERFEKSWRGNALNQIPEWREVERFYLIADIGQYVMEGLAFGRLNRQVNDRRTSKVLEYSKQLLIKMLREDDQD